jgi:hypothetical protein
MQSSDMSLYLSNHYWLIADQRFRLGVAIALPCVFLALAWRTIVSKDPPQDPHSTEKPPTQSRAPPISSTTTKTAANTTTETATVAPATNTRVTMREPSPITTARATTQAPAVPPKATTAVRAPRTRRTVPEKKAEAAIVQVEEERPATPETPTSKPKRKSTITAETTTKHQQQDHHQHHYQHSSQAPRRETDSASIGSGGSSEHKSSSSSNYKNKTLRMGKKTLQRAWSKRPFAGNSPAAVPTHAGDSILFPGSPTVPSVNLRG